MVMVFYFLTNKSNFDQETYNYFSIFYLISSIFWPIFGIYSNYRLHSEGDEDIDLYFNIIAAIMLGGYGFFFHTFIPFYLLIRNEGLGYFGRLTLFILFTVFIILYLHYITIIERIIKTEKKEKPEIEKPEIKKYVKNPYK